MKNIQSVKGFNDLLPCETFKFQYIESTITNILNSYGFLEIRTPIIESTELFNRSIGDSTDIISKEMYSFESSDKSLTLRPEGTVGVARCLLQNGLTGAKQKLWYSGYMFRAENPQKGRYRQFQQIGVEVYNQDSPRTEIEQISLIWNICKKLDITQSITLQVNSLGDIQAREDYKKAFKAYLENFKEQLDYDSLVRLDKNPLRILDSKNEQVQSILVNAPKILDFINEESRENFDYITKGLDYLNIKYVINQGLVRGLDYYNDFVFEFIANSGVGSQNSFCAGGRYDSLMSQIGGKNTPAFGFAIGIERLVLIVDELNKIKEKSNSKTISICTLGDEAYLKGLILRDNIIKINKDWTVYVNNESSSLKNQLKRANKDNIAYSIIIGEQELLDDNVILKDMITDKEQQIIIFDDISNYIALL
jgi:histidyl-tRNA synthetase